MQVCSEKALAIIRKIKPPFVNIELGSTAKFNNKRRHPKMDNNSLAHTKWNCKYYIVFAGNV
jgi:hypothetical protein